MTTNPGGAAASGSAIVLRGGTVLTMDEAGTVLTGADVLVVGDRIAAVGSGSGRPGRARSRSTPTAASSCRA